MFRFTIGADPEVFVTSAETGKIVPICGKVGGTKKEPKPFDTNGAFKYQEDNVALELNFPVLIASGGIYGHVRSARQLIERLLTPLKLVAKYDVSSFRFPKKDLTSDQAKTIGCDPDWDAYEGEAGQQRKPFKHEDLGTFRHVGGHIHFGYDKQGLNLPEHIFVQLVDAVVYLPYLPHDKQTNRRAKYGLAGLYRPKEYGVEYRSMSNFWLQPNMAESLGMTLNSFMHSLHHNEQKHQWPDIYAELPQDDIREEISLGGSPAHAELVKKVRGILNSHGVRL